MNTPNQPTIAVRRGRIARPQKLVVYGPEGVGKSTLASQMPSPVFIDTEGGTHHLDIARIDTPPNWTGIMGAIAQLGRGGHSFRTLVIDTADWLEKRLVEHLCAKASKESIEDFGYGRGWVLLAEEFTRFLVSLDGLVARGMHVVFLAHATVRKFEAPDQAGSYDRFELKLSRQVAPLLKEWADVILFANYVTKTAEKDNGKLRGVGGRERMLHATHSAACDAKNRHGLPDRLPFTIESLAPVFGMASAGTEPAPSRQEESAGDRIRAVFAPLADLRQVSEFLAARGQLKFGANGEIEGFEHLDPEYAGRMLAEPKRFVAAMQEWARGKEAA
jgi:GTPase SAR1 family protein